MNQGVGAGSDRRRPVWFPFWTVVQFRYGPTEVRCPLFGVKQSW
jgi:hypothetical protein